MTSTLPPDPWKALGVERNADKAEIRAAYKKLVLKCHPDKVQDPEQKALKADEFQKVQQAWELLNDDAERAKYEQKLRLAELQRAAKVQQEVKNSPNTSVPRTTSAKYATYEIRTAEPTSRYKSSPSSEKVYYTTTHTRSHEEMPSSRVYPVYEESDRRARRTASYEKPSKRDDDRRDREERRRRREEEGLRISEKDRELERERDREREREREKEREREARKAEKKRLEREREKEREKERRRATEEKRRPVYVEEYDKIIHEDEKYVTGRAEKKRSSSRKHDEARERDRERERDRDRERDREREREKSSSRRTKSPHVSSDRKHLEHFEYAASYLASAGSSVPAQKAAFWMSQTPPDPSPHTPLAPTPPPVEFEEESIRHSASRAAGRRASNDPARSREKLKYDLLDTPKARPIPTLAKSYSTPPPAPESPPRVSRSQTTPLDAYAGVPMPSLARNQTWAAGTAPGMEYYDIGESEDDRERRRHRSRRTRSPSAHTRYKVVDGIKTSRLESSSWAYGGESPTSRRYASEVLDGHMAHSPSSTYRDTQFRVKEAKKYSPSDVKYAQYDAPVYYSSSGAEGYPVGVA